MKATISINGVPAEGSDASISVMDTGLLYGYGVFEGIRVYNGKPFLIDEHLDRLYESAQSVCLGIPMDRKDLADSIHDTVSRHDKKDSYIRLVVTGGGGIGVGFEPTTKCRASVIVIVADITLYPPEAYSNGIKLLTASTRQLPSNCIPSQVKSLNYLNNILAKIESRKGSEHYDEVLMLNTRGEVAECTADNIFIVCKGQLLTPPITADILNGVTRRLTMRLCAESGMTCVESPLVTRDLYTADECFMTGTAAEIVPVVKIDAHIIKDGKPGAITKVIMKAYKEFIANSGCMT